MFNRDPMWYPVRVAVKSVTPDSKSQAQTIYQYCVQYFAYIERIPLLVRDLEHRKLKPKG